MCVIAGYSGNKQAAPILIEMMRKIEYFDGGYATGIATIHEGKLYVAKSIGDVEMLLRTTDALNLPGTTGIIHSRPGHDYISTAHPYVDASGKLALVENGTRLGTANEEFYAQLRECMDNFLDRGIIANTSYDISPENSPKTCTKDGKAFYYVEPFALYIGDIVKDAPQEKMKESLALAVQKNHERFPIDNITVSIHANLPDTVTVGTVSRPMSVMEADGETYLASCAIAFPENVKGKVSHLPQCSVSQITPNGLEFFTKELDGVRVEQVTDRVLQYFRTELEKCLVGKKDKPASIYEFAPAIPNDIWSEPMVDCKYAIEGQMLKPKTSAVYQALWSFQQEGRLHSSLGCVCARENPSGWPKYDIYFTKFWLD
ncbi:MAG: hypothetical protein IKA17_02780 [Clostridia bacterium]|nr:hypothetical protein [Clostridia bacterium]